MGSTPKPVTPTGQTGAGIASIAAGANGLTKQPSAAPLPQSLSPFQPPPEEEAPVMPLSTPSLAVPFAPNSSNPTGAPNSTSPQPDPRMAALRNLFHMRGR